MKSVVVVVFVIIIHTSVVPVNMNNKIHANKQNVYYMYAD